MTYPGPWTTPPDPQQIALFNWANTGDISSFLAATDDAAANSTSTIGRPRSTARAATVGINTTTTRQFFYQETFVNIGWTDGQLVWHPAWPDNAVDVEYDGTGTASAVQVDVTTLAPVYLGTDGRTELNATSMIWVRADGLIWRPRTTLAGDALLATIPSAGGTATLTGLGLVDFTESSPGQHTMWLCGATDRQRSGPGLTFTSADTGDDSISLPIDSVVLTVTFHPPRYRWIYQGGATPPVRQYPRDDALGHSPRSFVRGGPASRQHSIRGGFRGTYL